MTALMTEAARLEQAGRVGTAIEVVLRLPPNAPPAIHTDALGRVRALAVRASADELAHALMVTPLGQPLSAPVMLAYARALMLSGRAQEATRYARAAIGAGAEGDDATAALALSGNAAGDAARPPTMIPAGLVVTLTVPLSTAASSPRFSAADLALQGARMALSNTGASAGMTLSANAPGVALPTTEPLPLALRIAPDPEAARTLAAYAQAMGITQVVLLRGSDPLAIEEARLFTQAFEAAGGSVLRTFPYASGARSIREVLDAVRNLRPHALMLAVSPQDVPTLWPLVRAGGLPNQGVRTMATSSWTSVLNSGLRPTQSVDGVLSVAPAPPEPSSALARFTQLNDPTRSSLGPAEDDALALGFDAASLLLLALQAGAGGQTEVDRALAQIRDFKGASGTVSVENGGVTRRQRVVCIQASQATVCPRP
jgi:ABC-type branched-subunit amino acid transport system substrate-binding protein